ncbi:hypothetical protein [Citrobacter koseri]|uniref:hypothetical protein n=1 Tax=Citrobacter koseri TaxID=545 RepID=UPI00200B7423|nr:hypothetical protein [Citrobacter koseri]
MSKLSNGFILRAVWHAVLKQLPYRATMNYFGDGKVVGICRNEHFWMRTSTHICTTGRKHSLRLPLSDSQSMNRIKRLVDDGRLEREQMTGGAFYFRLPDSLNQPAFERCLELMRSEGLTEKATNVSNYDEIVERVSGKLMAEFGDIDLRQESAQ